MKEATRRRAKRDGERARGRKREDTIHRDRNDGAVPKPEAARCRRDSFTRVRPITGSRNWRGLGGKGWVTGERVTVEKATKRQLYDVRNFLFKLAIRTPRLRTGAIFYLLFAFWRMPAETCPSGSNRFGSRRFAARFDEIYLRGNSSRGSKKTPRFREPSNFDLRYGRPIRVTLEDRPLEIRTFSLENAGWIGRSSKPSARVLFRPDGNGRSGSYRVLANESRNGRVLDRPRTC